MKRPRVAAFGRRARTRARRWGSASAARAPHRLWWLVLIVGLGSGLVGAAYVEVLRLVSDVLGPGGFSRPAHLLVLASVGITIGVLTVTLGNPGDVELLVDNIHVTGGRSDIRELRSLIPVSLLGIGAGSAIGPEAPLVQTTGALGTWIARNRRLDVSETRVLTITGMAAGFTVLFGAPFGSAIFALEILHRRGLQYYEALLPAAIGSLSGYLVYAGVTGFGFRPVWTFPETHALRPVDFAVGLGAGVVGGMVAGGFTLCSKVLREAVRRLPAVGRPMLGGVALGGLAFLSPYALTFGEGQIQTVSTAKLAVATLLLAAVVKFVASSMIVSSGWRGGFIIPLFFIGVALGSAAHQLLGVDLVVAIAASMVAVNVGVTKTPFGSSVVVAEMAGLRLLPPVLLASIVALFLTRRVSMIKTQRARAGSFAGSDPPRTDDGDGVRDGDRPRSD